ncbi:hypothetical protein CNO14_06645 [Borrelia miyamotoi]|uniref:Uncharacterized protein n=1 Tax=Borrelia miyamotoi TaxID=47466 RepID=A0AAQ3CMR5_9SPIR|nr:hypothetical protein [Borrelia miyamotoi]AHH04606.1 Hypothetical protein BOM_0063 [Borrelia miyamotoi FR64b]WAZ70137.1 hypothetical protein O5403_00285 [Borrelia miyamotoi]WCB90975.1 hypothetical protein CNO11_07000 [Borrelia miyamotoi]WCL22108.1 hypothetical protein CNO10_07060 [Borrelia miyamotoi]WDE70336.1 hypothetical protein CNO12_07070 [Borrelia miyamotoi]
MSDVYFIDDKENVAVFENGVLVSFFKNGGPLFYGFKLRRAVF